MKRKNFFLLAAMATALIGLPSCSSDETEISEKIENPAELKITASMTPLLDVSTRAAYDLQGTSLIDFTKVGIYVWYTGNTAAKTSAPVYNGYENVSVTGQTGTGPWDLTPSQTLGFPIDNHDVDVYLYAPYKSSPTQTDMCMEHTVASDQSLTEGYVASDFLYGKATAKYSGSVSPEIDKTARVTMYHAMSKLIFKVVNSGVDPANMTDITLQNFFTKTTINMPVAIGATLSCGSGSTTYNVDAATVKSNIKVWGTSGTGAVTTSDVVSNGVAVIVPPQTTDSDAKVSVSTNNGSSTFTAVANFNGKTLNPGKVYTYNLKLIGTGVTISLVSITDWDSSESPTGTDADLDFSSWSSGS